MKPLSQLILASFVNLIIIIITVSIGSQITLKPSQEVAPVKGRDGEAERGLITPSPTRQVIRKNVIVTVTPKPNQTSLQKSQNIAPTTTPAPDNRCLITVDEVKYDVTTFRQTHSGGNIFNCGTDMSQIFWGQHDTKILSRMQPYKI